MAKHSETFGGSADHDDKFAYEESTFSIPKALSLFFGAVLFAGLFFGAGYHMGHTAALNQQAAAQVSAVPAPVVPHKDKPAAALEVTPEEPAAAAPSQEPMIQESDSSNSTKQSADLPKMKSGAKATASQTGAFTVQVAAVRHQEDAEALLGALRKKEYPVFLASANSDSLFHVRVGPFSNQKDAEAMRSRLSGDGYNAILKK